MKARYRTKSGNLEIEIEGSTVKELFGAVAELSEVFNEIKCGLCQSDDIRQRVRTVEDDNYYEYHCEKCNARLELGQNKKGGGLYPKRKTADGKFDTKSRGWAKWDGTKVPAKSETPKTEPGKGK